MRSMNVGDLRKVIADLPDNAAIGVFATGCEDIISVVDMGVYVSGNFIALEVRIGLDISDLTPNT